MLPSPSHDADDANCRSGHRRDRFTYDLETMLELEKATGRVSCDRPGLAALAQGELDRCLEARTGADVTRIIQKLFERRADLFPIREQGGAYFCPQEHTPFLDKVERFVTHLNGKMNRFPVPAGTPEGDRSVKDSVAAGLGALIAEHRSAIAAFGLAYDAHGPSVTALPGRRPDANGWYNHPLSVSFSGSDPTSGVATCSSASYGGPDNPAASIPGTCTSPCTRTCTGASASTRTRTCTCTCHFHGQEHGVDRKNVD